MAVDVRKALPQDAEAMGALHVRAWRAGYVGLMPQPDLDTLDVEERADLWRRGSDRDRPDSGILVATVAGRVAGSSPSDRPRPQGRGSTARCTR